MRTIGLISTVLFACIAAGGMFLFVRSIPEIRRYLKIRDM